MQPIKDRDNVHVILLEDGSYWMSGGFSGNRDGIMSTLNLSSATFLPFEDACYKANKLNENGKRCEVISVLLERKKLEKKIEQLEREKEELEKENAELKDYVRSIFGQGLKFMKEVM